MKRLVGTVSRGIRTPIITEGDDIVKIVVDSVVEAAENHEFSLRDRDIVGITEAVVGRAQGNYATVDQMAADIVGKFGEKSKLGLVFPILSRNRFAVCLKAFARACDEIVVLLSYPADEVGNRLLSEDLLLEKDVDPRKDVLTDAKFCEIFGEQVHEFTGVDYLKLYRGIIEDQGCKAQIILSNDPRTITDYADKILYCDVHSRHRTKRILSEYKDKQVLGLEDILSSSVDGNGYNEEYGLLGSNLATEDSVKLFPRDTQATVEKISAAFKERTGKNIEVLVYGDGAFKDPVGKIWELADPVVSPGFTKGLKGQPNEVKLKYIADNMFPHLKGKELEKAISDYIGSKKPDLTGEADSQGTTPRRLTDLVGSLCDLTSGSGDKGTPVVLIQGYFDSYSD